MMMNLQAMLMLLCTMFLTMGTTMGAPHLRSLSEESHLDKSAVCKKVSPGVYQQVMVKSDRVSHMVEKFGVLAGRCGPEHCEYLCMEVEKAQGFESHGNGFSCECKF